MSFNQNKKYPTKIASQAAGDEDIYSLNKHALGPGALAESEWASAGLASPNMTSIREYRLQRVRDSSMILSIFAMQPTVQTCLPGHLTMQHDML